MFKGRFLCFQAVKNLPVKKKKKVAGPASQGMPLADRLVYLTGIPIDATEQEVTDLVSSFGKINNVILLPCSEEESEKGQGQKVSLRVGGEKQQMRHTFCS